jgi:S1-C subfamily serine protease
MWIDLLIIAAGIATIYRGRKIGFVRQLCATGGFFGGLLFGAWLEPYAVNLVHGTDTRAILTVVTTLGSAFILMTVGEYLGFHFKYRLLPKVLNGLDSGLGAVLSTVTLLLSVWLVASVMNSSSLPPLQKAVRSSNIIGELNRILPSAPGVIANLGRLIDPNGFPDVFIGNEPVPRTKVNLPALGDLASAVNADRDSVVRIKGQGCGGIVTGSGFVVGSGLIATNAHVVAGIRHPYVQDVSGNQAASVIWFDPDLDFAVLRVVHTASRPLKIDGSEASRDTPAAVLGYPGGGDFSAKPALILDEIEAAGRDIYGGGHTLRDVYELQADIEPGNSGGPVVAKDGRVVGMVFAESTSYNHVGYALTGGEFSSAIKQAAAENLITGTGRCAE